MEYYFKEITSLDITGMTFEPEPFTLFLEPRLNDADRRLAYVAGARFFIFVKDEETDMNYQFWMVISLLGDPNALKRDFQEGWFQFMTDRGITPGRMVRYSWLEDGYGLGVRLIPLWPKIPKKPRIIRVEVKEGVKKKPRSIRVEVNEVVKAKRGRPNSSQRRKANSSQRCSDSLIIHF